MEGLLFQPAYKPTYSPGRVSQMLVENPGLLGPRQRTTGRLRFMIRWGDRFLMLPVPLSPLSPPPVCTFFFLTVCLTSLEFILCMCVCVCVCVCSQSCPTLCDPVDCSPPGSSVMGFSRQEYWNGLPFPTQGLNPGLLYFRQML